METKNNQVIESVDVIQITIEGLTFDLHKHNLPQITCLNRALILIPELCRQLIQHRKIDSDCYRKFIEQVEHNVLSMEVCYSIKVRQLLMKPLLKIARVKRSVTKRYPWTLNVRKVHSVCRRICLSIDPLYRDLKIVEQCFREEKLTDQFGNSFNPSIRLLPSLLFDRIANISSINVSR